MILSESLEVTINSSNYQHYLKYYSNIKFYI